MFNHSNEDIRANNLNENKVGVCLLDKNSNKKTTRSTRGNGLKIKKTEQYGDIEKRNSRAKTSLNRKHKSEIQSVFVDTNFETRQKQEKNKDGASPAMASVISSKHNNCLISSEDNSINEEYCYKNDESKISIDDDLTIRFSQDPVVSQDEPICDVRWDCGSPEIIKKVKKRRGHYSAESVKNAIANFNDAHLKPQKESFNYVGVKLHSRDLGIRTDKSKLHKAKESRAVRKKQHGFQEMVVSFLQDMTRRQAEVREENTSRSYDVSAVIGQSKEDSPVAADDGAAANSDVNYWSDEDLFKDNSFLIEATCNSEQLLGLTLDSEINMESSICQRKNGDAKSSSLEDVTFSPNTSIIPSSCVSSVGVAGAIHVKTTRPDSSLSTVPPATASHRPVQPKLASVTTRQIGKVDSSSRSLKVNTCAANGSLSWERANPNGLTGHCLKSTEGNGKVGFKKFNSFNTNILHNNTSNKCNLTRSNAESPLRKTLSFDSSYSSQSASQHTPVNRHNLPCTKNLLAANVPKKNPITFKQSVKPVSCTTFSAPLESQTLSSEVMNLPEDVLRQLLEPDEILDSQEDNSTKGSSQNNSSTKIDNKTMNSAQLKTKNKFVSDKTLSAQNSIPPTSSTVLNFNKQLKPTNSKNFSSLNPVLGVQKAMPSSFKPLQSQDLFSVASNQKCSLNLTASSKSVRPSNSVCSKLSEEPANTQKLSDSFIENVFNDSFLNDEAMYESQILPILDQVESEALRESQCTQQEKLTPPIQCTSEEIERKRQAALQKRTFSLSQRKCLK